MESKTESAMTNIEEFLKLVPVTPSVCSIEQFSLTVLFPTSLKWNIWYFQTQNMHYIEKKQPSTRTITTTRHSEKPTWAFSSGELKKFTNEKKIINQFLKLYHLLSSNI